MSQISPIVFIAYDYVLFQNYLGTFSKYNKNNKNSYIILLQFIFTLI